MRNHPKPTDATPAPGEVLDRRSLLRRAGTVAAIAGGAAVVQAAAGGVAEASAGGTAVLGANDAGVNTTSITSTSTTDSTLNLTNTGSAHSPLSLTASPAGYTALATKTAGELYNDSGDLFYVEPNINPGGSLVFTEATANQVVGITPIRMLDTRTAPGRTFVIQPLSGPSPLNASGQLLARRWLQLDMTSLATFYESAFINLTAVAPTAGGYLSIAPQEPAAGAAPATSNLNYVKGVTIANAAVAPTIDGSLWIYSFSTTHILVDVNALNLPSSDPSILLVPPAIRMGNNARLRSAFAARRAARAAQG